MRKNKHFVISVLFILIIPLTLFSITGCKTVKEIIKEEKIVEETSTEEKPEKDLEPEVKVDTSNIEKIPDIISISPEEVYEIITGNEDYVILDVRTQDEYNKGHLDKALFIPVEELGERIVELPTDKPIIVYCRSGIRSRIAAEILIENEFNQVYDMGGIIDWNEKGFPIVVEEDTEEIIEIISIDEAYELFKNDKDYLFIDARSEDDFKVKHIEGAINIPLAEIEDRLDEIPVDRPIIVYCDCTGHCNKSGPVAKILRENGYSQVQILAGRALSDWEEKGYPITDE